MTFFVYFDLIIKNNIASFLVVLIISKVVYILLKNQEGFCRTNFHTKLYGIFYVLFMWQFLLDIWMRYTFTSITMLPVQFCENTRDFSF